MLQLFNKPEPVELVSSADSQTKRAPELTNCCFASQYWQSLCVCVSGADCCSMWVQGAFPAYSMRTDSILWPRDTDLWGRQKAEGFVVVWPWVEGQFVRWWCCGPWPTSALRVMASGLSEGLQGDGEDRRDWWDRMPTERRSSALNEAGCGTSFFCWRSTLGQTYSTSER